MIHNFPKIIWQTHNHKQEWLPKHLNQIGATWKNLNPGWDYRYIDQVQRDETVRKYPEIYDIYKYQLPVIQSDIWRFIITYEHGGCYADMDSVCTIPLDYMLQDIEGDPEIITVPEYGGVGNIRNYFVKSSSSLMQSVIDKIRVFPYALNFKNSQYAFDIFINEVYSSPNVSKLFSNALHHPEYKRTFKPEKHQINYYGQEMSYLDFIDQNGLSLYL
jgi:hypothetical protein